MKQKLLFTLMLLCMSICSSNIWAEREKPTMPEASLESGKSYYLYNVETGLLYSSTWNSKVGENPIAFTIEQQDNGAYTIKYDGRYLESYSTYLGYNSYSNNQCHWDITSENESYLICRSTLNYYYAEGEYFGVDNDNYVCPNMPVDGKVHWLFIPANEQGDHYVAEMKLYLALNKADEYTSRGWDITYYENIYTQRANNTTEDITTAAKNLSNGVGMSAGYKAPYWSEYPILWQCAEGNFGDNYYSTWASSYNDGFEHQINSGETSSISATVNLDKPSCFVYSVYGYDINLSVYVDGALVRKFNKYYQTSTERRYFEELPQGTHTVTWVVDNTDHGSYVTPRVSGVGVMNSDLITVSLLEPGSLGTEVLYNTDHIKNVHRLKVIGKMNDDDWSKVKMMHYLQDLDLSEAVFTSIPDNQFSCSYPDTSSLFLHKLVLPEGMTTIGREAFYGSYIEKLDLPSTMKTVKEKAFNESRIHELIMPDDMTDLADERDYRGVFASMYWLEKVVLPKNLKTVKRRAFMNNPYCQEITLPDGLETIEDNAFYGNEEAVFNKLPESLKYINEMAFYGCKAIETVTIPESVVSIGNYAFSECTGLKEAVINTKIYNAPVCLFSRCNNLETLRLNSPTLVTYNNSSYSYPVDASQIAKVKLIVPSFQVSNYKLDNYWYNFKEIEGFDTSEIDDWTINNPLTLNHDRFDGTPTLHINGSRDRLTSLKINGDKAMTINNLELNSGTYYDTNYPGMIQSNCQNISIQGDVTVNLYTNAKQWYFFSLPFDMKVSEITHSAEGTQMAIRYYDGENRATYGATGSWKNYDSEAIIPAGTGFILQTNVNTYNCFKAVNNDSKQLCVSNKEIMKELSFYDSEAASNKGWNLIGNPWQCYYNDHMLNFSGPITVWDADRRTYTAYSITDDDYAIRPNEAFFVQCPNEELNTIGFPTQGRQLNAIIESQNAVKGEMGATNRRQIVNLSLSNGEQEDQTRVVLNEQASLAYETTCDASKFMSMDNSVPQLYTLDEEGIQYAINERPLAEGEVELGFYAAKAGEFTISTTRCDAEQVFITDRLTGETTEITRDAYSFTAEAGNNNARFVLTFISNDATVVESIEIAKNQRTEIFSVDGKFLGNDMSKLGNGIYVVRQGKKVTKVSVR